MNVSEIITKLSQIIVDTEVDLSVKEHLEKLTKLTKNLFGE
ncbi:hypothetical protein [Flavobacterium columnare]|nr:hypothetical protein [Flavobacterium columnare]